MSTKTYYRIAGKRYAKGDIMKGRGKRPLEDTEPLVEDILEQVGPYSVALFPERVGNDHILVLFVDGQREQKFWRLSTAPWGNRKLRRNGFVPWSKDERYYVRSSPTKRHQYLYVNPESSTI